MLGFAAAETDEPRKVIPKAMVVLLSLTPWNALVAQLKAGGGAYSSSPFVLVFSGIGAHFAAHILNFVILTATLSVYNNMVYSSSRLLYGMALEGNAPKSLMQVNKRGVPVRAIVYPGIVTAFCIVLNYVAPAGVIELLMSLIVAALVITWVVVIVAHMGFRMSSKEKGIAARFPAPLAPFTNYLCLLAMAVVVVVMLLTPDIRVSAIAIPIWIAIVYVSYRIVAPKTLQVPVDAS